MQLFKIKGIWLYLLITTFSLPAAALQNLSSQGQNNVDLVSKAKLCTNETSKVARLTCFDTVFGTPLYESKIRTLYLTMPTDIKLKIKAELERKDELSFLSQSIAKNNEPTGLILTVPASNLSLKKSNMNSHELKQPILMFSCIDDISRVELVLPKPITEPRVEVSIVELKQNAMKWIVDDSGFVLRSGRGLPAINIMKKILTHNTISLRSDNEQINGLFFDSSNLNTSIKPLRKQCGW